MAQRRMFSKDVTESDKFLDLSFAAQALYFQLGMSADDEGFVSSAKRIARAIGTGAEQLEELEKSGHLIGFPDSGVYAITHFFVNTAIRADRAHETIYQAEKAQLERTENDIYIRRQQTDNQTATNIAPERQPTDNQTATNSPPNDGIYNSIDSIDKVDKSARGRAHVSFSPPTVQEVEAFCRERGNGIDAEAFVSHYAAQGWVLGSGQKMKDWKMAVITWEKRRKEGWKNGVCGTGKGDRVEGQRDLYES